MLITSKDNQTIKEIKKLKETKYRKEKFIVEGFKMLEEAVNENADIEIVVVQNGNEELLAKVKRLLEKQNNNNFSYVNEAKTNECKAESSKDENCKYGRDTTERCKDKRGKGNGLGFCTKIIEVTDNVFMQLTDVKTPQGVLAVIRKNQVKFLENNNNLKDADFILALDGVQDPRKLRHYNKNSRFCKFKTNFSFKRYS